MEEGSISTGKDRRRTLNHLSRAGPGRRTDPRRRTAAALRARASHHKVRCDAGGVDGVIASGGSGGVVALCGCGVTVVFEVHRFWAVFEL